MQPERSYTPPEATLADCRRMCKALGIERSVLVHSSIYGTDLTSLVDTLEACRDWMRGVAVIDESIGDDGLARRDRAGVRFNVLSKGGTPLAKARVIGARVARHGWHVQLLIDLAGHPPGDDWNGVWVMQSKERFGEGPGLLFPPEPLPRRGKPAVLDSCQIVRRRFLL
jgi:predicted TIM-barrel fold metal-dependent hydrolase